jgi:hypothetical protein
MLPAVFHPGNRPKTEDENKMNRTVAGSYFVRWESGRPLYNYCFKQWLGDKTTVEKMQELIAFCYQKANEGYYEIRSQFYDL